jgi:hypothetical protein
MIKRLYAAVISVMAVGTAVTLVALPKDDFSVNENRTLQALPQLDLKSILSGEYMEDMSTYLSDRFPARDSLVSFKAQMERKVLRSKYINGIYVAEDGYYIEDYRQPENTEAIVKSLNSFEAKLEAEGIKADVMIVPTAVSIYRDKLPKMAAPYDQNRVLEEYYSSLRTNNIDIRQALSGNKDATQFYYRYDHHWTTSAAYIAYRQYCLAKGFEPLDMADIEVKSVEGFYGTIYSKLGYADSDADTIELYSPRGQSVEVSYDGREDNSLFDMSYADKKDKYSIFLSNLNSLIEITNNSADTDRELVVAKDSYANCLVPLLTKHYKRIYVFDTRSYRGSVSEFVAEHSKVKDVLVLYNINTIDSDTGIRAIY